MTDKQKNNSDQAVSDQVAKAIIIDGVDVSGCEHYTGNIDYLTNKDWTCRAKIIGTKCEECSNCYYKQLKRKEQECEKAKKIITVALDDFNLEYGTRQYDRLLDGARELGIEVKDYE